MQKHYSMSYRQRVFFCKACNIHIEVLGESLDGATCHCCDALVTSLPLELDNQIKVKKTVTPTVK